MLYVLADHFMIIHSSGFFSVLIIPSFSLSQTRMIIIDIQKTVFIPQKHLAQTSNTDQGDVSVIVVTLKEEPFPELYFDTNFIKSSGSKSVRDI